jgi:hypothetical protein
MKGLAQCISLLMDRAFFDLTNYVTRVTVVSRVTQKRRCPMKRFLDKITNILADAALLEMGVAVAPVEQPKAVRETLEENLIEIALAEAGDYDQIHEAILREHRRADDMIRPDDCGCDDNEVCFA